MNQSLSPVRYRNDFGLENSKYLDQTDLSDRKGYITDNLQPAQPYKPYSKKQGQSKLPQEKWTGYTTTNYEEEKVKKDKLERRKQYDQQLKQRLTNREIN